MAEINKHAVLPQSIDDATFAFPASVEHLMPKYAEIPKEFKQWQGTKWNQFFDDAFFSGVKNVSFKPKPGIDAKAAWRHVQTIMRSFEPKHEHKTAACAYLLSLWFDDITYEVAR